MNVNDVHRGIKKYRKLTRVGRGPGSGHGKTAGRGHKGQGQLAGWTAHPAFEGGQMLLARRVPKRGFHNRWAKVVVSVNLGEIDSQFQAGEEVTPEKLVNAHLISPNFDMVKILGQGDLTKKLKISAHKFSESALEKLKKVGAESVVLEGPKPVVRNKQGTRRKAAVAAATKNKKK